MFNLALSGVYISYERRVCYGNIGQPGCRWEDVISLAKYRERMWTLYVWLGIGKLGSLLFLWV
jgi:hypothetical protein